MNYYIIKDSLVSNVIGNDYPQAYKFIKGYNPDAADAIFSLYKYRTVFPDFTPNLNGILLSKSTKLTDFVSHGFDSSCFIVSEQAKHVLESYNLCSHQIYSLGLYKNNKKYNYFLLKIISDYSDYVNYQESTFVEYNISSGKVFGSVSVPSKEDLMYQREIVKERTGSLLQTIWGNKIIMSTSFEQEIDFFEIGIIDSSTYISERLKTDIENKGLTGWEFIPASNLIIQ